MKMMSLKTKYLILFSVFAVTLMLLFSLAVYGELQTLHRSVSEVSQEKVMDSLINEVVTRSEVLLEAMSASIAHPVYQSNLVEIDKQLDLIASTPLVRQALVYDLNGHILHDGTPGIEHFDSFVQSILPVRISLQDAGFRLLSDQLLMNHPIFYQGERVGGVLLWLSLDPVHQSVREADLAISEVLDQSEQQFLRFLIYLIVTFACLALLLSGLLSHSISRPVQALMEYSQKLALGRWDLPPLLSKGDEFSRLGSAFRNMAIQIRNNVRNIEQLAFNDTLTGAGNRTFF